MTVGPMGNTPGLSGSQNDAASHVRRNQSVEKAEKAEGLGATDADQETSDRDADGRRLWEAAADEKDKPVEQQEEESPDAPIRSKDPTGNSGGLLDISG